MKRLVLYCLFGVFGTRLNSLSQISIEPQIYLDEGSPKTDCCDNTNIFYLFLAAGACCILLMMCAQLILILSRNARYYLSESREEYENNKFKAKIDQKALERIIYKDYIAQSPFELI